MRRFVGRHEDVAFALLRVVLALVYWSHGARWIFGAFGGRAPVPLASMFGVAGLIELACGTCIAFGLLTSWAAFLASGEMAFAYFIVHVPRGGWMPIQNGGEITVALCFSFLYMAAHGSGPFSIDAWLGSRRVVGTSMPPRPT